MLYIINVCELEILNGLKNIWKIYINIILFMKNKINNFCILNVF